MNGAWIAAALAALVGAPHCAAMCGPLAGPALGSRWRTIAFFLGKTLTYATLGAIAGGTASLAPSGSVWVSALTVALLGWFALGLAGVSLPRVRSLPLAGLAARLARRTDGLGTLLYGAAIGLLPCGLVYSALALAVTAGSAASGAVALVLFGLCTVPALGLAGWGLRRLAASRRWLRVAVAVVVFLVGAGSVTFRSTSWLAHGEPEPPACHEHR